MAVNHHVCVQDSADEGEGGRGGEELFGSSMQCPPKIVCVFMFLFLNDGVNTSRVGDGNCSQGQGLHIWEGSL